MVVIVAIFYLLTSEGYIYATQTEAKAQAAAQIIFSKNCKEEGLDQSLFHGPNLVPMHNAKYNFVWTRADGETATVTVSYLPYDLEYSESLSLVEQSWKKTE